MYIVAYASHITSRADRQIAGNTGRTIKALVVSWSVLSNAAPARDPSRSAHI